ncbi:MAG: hypothetical protein ACI4NP_02845 [Thermoguttaceae bacterium]
MSAHNPTGSIGSFFSNPIRRALVLAAIGFVGIGLIGCQSTKNNCASCPFSRDKAEIDDIEERGQEASATSGKDTSEPAAPNVSQTVEPLDRGLFGTRLFKRSKTRATSPAQVESESSLPAVAATSELSQDAQSVSSAETPVATESPKTFDSPTQSEALASAASALNQHFPNTAADVKKEDPVEIPEAPAAAAESSQEAPATATPRYQSVGPSDSPAPDQQLGFAPSELDHSASSAESTQPAQSDGPVLSDVSSPKEAAQPESAESPETTPSPAPVQDASAPVEEIQASSPFPVALPDQTALQAAFATKQPTSLKTSTTPRYVYNTASTSTRPTVIGAPRSRVASSAVNARSSNGVGAATRFVPNGQTSKIIPGKELGVIEISSQNK